MKLQVSNDQSRVQHVKTFLVIEGQSGRPIFKVRENIGNGSRDRPSGDGPVTFRGSNPLKPKFDGGSASKTAHQSTVPNAQHGNRPKVLSLNRRFSEVL